MHVKPHSEARGIDLISKRRAIAEGTGTIRNEGERYKLRCAPRYCPFRCPAISVQWKGLAREVRSKRMKAALESESPA